MASKYRASKSRSGSRTPSLADGEGKSQLSFRACGPRNLMKVLSVTVLFSAWGPRLSTLGLRSDRRCLSKFRPSSIGSDGGQRPPSPRHFSGAEAQAHRFVERLYPLTPGRFGRDDFFTVEVLTLKARVAGPHYWGPAL